MGQKVNPHGLRVGINKEWDSVWYAEKNFGDLLVEDNRIRKYIKKKLFLAGVSRITISRTTSQVRVTVHTAKPGIVIGRSGQAIAELAAEVQKFVADPKVKAVINVEEIKRPELSSQLVAEDIAKQLENRVTFRRAMKQAMTRSMKFGARGIKTQVSGRLGGADIARSEHYHEGTIPLQTLRADIDYGFAEADTTYGKLGVKVWIYKGEIIPKRDSSKREAMPMPSRREDRPRREHHRREGARA
ncbi:MAG: 30S ribosomal protein S3 [Clostridiales bacterium]|nr:30S ribosomal protein S3 [Clostridiales bacterium]